MNILNIISVSETATRELRATGARLVVQISGQSFFTGSEALKKATEVAACVGAIGKLGIPEEDIRLLDVATEVESGFLSKSSSATYELEIKCRSIELLAPVIAAISAQRNSKLTSIAWDYLDLAKTQMEILQEAVHAANASAAAISEALNISLLGVHKLSYSVSGLDTDLQINQCAIGRSRSSDEFKAGMADLSAGLRFSHTTQVSITVKADFIVAAFPNSK
jgi:uncharacterized protein YggE